MTHDAQPAPPDDHCSGCLSRRRVLTTGVAGLAAVALAGCGTYGDEPAAAGPPPPAAVSPTGSGSAGTAIATLADVPVGGAVIIAAQRVVLTQPEAGTVKAFSATCTHAGCAVNAVANGKITCPCHGSAFNLDGSVANGPAARPLPAVDVTVVGEEIQRA